MMWRRQHRFGTIVYAVLLLSNTRVAGSDFPAHSSQTGEESNGPLARLFPKFLKKAIADATKPFYHVWDQGRVQEKYLSPRQPDEENFPDSQDETTDEVEGARLLSASLQVVSTTFGLLADSVRVSGETAAGMVGSSVKLTGTAIKTISAGFGAASRALDPEPTQQHNSIDQWGKLSSSRQRKELTSERLSDTHYGSRESDFRVMRNAKKVAATSIRLVGSVIDGFGESLLLAGAATEYLASTSVGVAEGTVRIVEDFAGVLSNTLSPDYERQASRPIGHSYSLNFRENPFRRNHTYVNFGSRGDGNVNTGSYDNERSNQETLMSSWLELLGFLRTEMSAFPTFLYADTGGTPSLAPEFLLLFTFC